MEKTLIIVLNDRETFELTTGPCCQTLIVHDPDRKKSPTHAYDLGAFIEDNLSDIQTPRYEVSLDKAAKNLGEMNDMFDIKMPVAE